MACVPALAQKKKTDPPKPACQLGLDQSPELRGFRLGMSQAAVLARLPGVTLEKPDKFGLARLRLSIIDPNPVIKAAPGGKAIQPDLISPPGEGSAFVIDDSRLPAFKGTRRIQMRFIDGRLSYLQVAYDDAIKWESIDQFVETVSATLKLSQDWRASAESDTGSEKELRCQGFVLTANTSGDPSDLNAGPELILQDVAAWEAMSKRQIDIVEKQKKQEDEKRKTFKP